MKNQHRTVLVTLRVKVTMKMCNNNNKYTFRYMFSEAERKNCNQPKQQQQHFLSLIPNLFDGYARSLVLRRRNIDSHEASFECFEKLTFVWRNEINK